MCVEDFISLFRYRPTLERTNGKFPRNYNNFMPVCSRVKITNSYGGVCFGRPSPLALFVVFFFFFLRYSYSFSNKKTIVLTKTTTTITSRYLVYTTTLDNTVIVVEKVWYNLEQYQTDWNWRQLCNFCAGSPGGRSKLINSKSTESGVYRNDVFAR